MGIVTGKPKVTESLDIKPIVAKIAKLTDRNDHTGSVLELATFLIVNSASVSSFLTDDKNLISTDIIFKSIPHWLSVVNKKAHQRRSASGLLKFALKINN